VRFFRAPLQGESKLFLDVSHLRQMKLLPLNKSEKSRSHLVLQNKVIDNLKSIAILMAMKSK
jgi:hypothetical protein